MSQKAESILLEFICEIFGASLRDDALAFQVGLVAAQDDIRVFAVRVRLQFGQPVADVEEGLLVGEVKEKQEAHCVAEESSG